MIEEGGIATMDPQMHLSVKHHSDLPPNFGWLDHSYPITVKLLIVDPTGYSAMYLACFCLPRFLRCVSVITYFIDLLQQ